MDFGEFSRHLRTAHQLSPDGYLARVPQTRACAVCHDPMPLTRAGVETHLKLVHGYSLTEYLRDPRSVSEAAASKGVGEALEALDWVSRCRYECVLCDEAPAAFRTLASFRRHLVTTHKETR